MRRHIYDKVEKALVRVLERSQSELVSQLVQHGLTTIDPANRAKQIIRELHAAWRFADRTVSNKLRQRRAPGWEALRDSWADSARRSAIVFGVFERNRRHDGDVRAVQKAVRGWTRKLTPLEHRLRARPMLPVHWENDIADALIGVLERELMRPLRFSRRPSGKTYGADLDVLVAAFHVAVRTGIIPNRKVLRGKETRQPGSANWFVSRMRYRRNREKRNAVGALTASDIISNQRLCNRQRRESTTAI